MIPPTIQNSTRKCSINNSNRKYQKLVRIGLTLFLLSVAFLLSIQNLFLKPKTAIDIETQNRISREVSKQQHTLDRSSNSTGDSSSNTNNHKENPVHSITVDEFLKFKLHPKQFSKYQHPFPCLSKESSSSTSSSSNNDNGFGIQYIKVFKTASSTVAHIVKYIATTRGKCREYSKHAAAHTFPHLQSGKSNSHIGSGNSTSMSITSTTSTIRTKSNQPNSFLFTFVREPTKRAVSDFFYTKVTQANQTVNLQNFKTGCCRSKQGLNGQAGFQLAYISTDSLLPEYTFVDVNLDDYTEMDDDKNVSVQNHTNESYSNSSSMIRIKHPEKLLRRINHVFDVYDFIGVSDRLNESLVALSFLLNLSITEIAYVSYRQSGSYLEVPNKKCVKIVPAEVSPDVKEYLKTEEWAAVTAADKLLHRTAMEALDNTIENVIGRDLFEERLSEYKELIQLMKECNEICSSTCSSDGEYREATTCRPCMNEKRKQWKIERNS